MRIEKVEFNIENVSALLAEISDSEIKSFLSNYYLSLDQVITTLSIPYLFMTIGYQKGMLKYLPFATIQKELEKLDGFEERDPKKHAEAIVEFFEEKIKKDSAESFNLAEEEIEKMLNSLPALTDAYRALGLNALVNTWTIFEGFSKELWRHTLNTHPRKFARKVINSNNSSNNEIEGINGKQISIGLLSKHNFDLSNNLGDILSAKYDFTGTNGIKIAFKDLLDVQNEELIFLNKKALSQLEITRHLVVHNSGIIDEDFLRRSSNSNETIGEKLNISHEDAGQMVNSSIDAVLGLYKLVQNHLEN